jgi:hypothetical protein
MAEYSQALSATSVADRTHLAFVCLKGFFS